MRRFVIAATAFAGMPMIAEAGETHVFTDVAVTSSLFDRGEQIAPLTVESSVGVETEIGDALVYGSFYRLLPVGGDAEAFDDEADYTLGLSWKKEDSYAANVSANWLTFPGEETKSSLELLATGTLAAPLEPSLTGFFDVRSEDWGLELLLGPGWAMNTWEVYTQARAGFVQAGDGSASRAYGGIEAGGSRALSRSVTLGFYARTDVADEESFADRINSGTVTKVRGSGVAAGVSLSVFH